MYIARGQEAYLTANSSEHENFDNINPNMGMKWP
jgi:hypothetical protein